MVKGTGIQLSLSLPEPAPSAQRTGERHNEPSPSYCEAVVYSYEDIRAERDRKTDAVHFGHILELVRHFE
jgi:hypothetical protein